MRNLNIKTMLSFSHLLGSSTKILMLILEYYKQWAGGMDDYLNGIVKYLWRCIKSGNFRPDIHEDVGTVGSSTDMALRKDK